MKHTKGKLSLTSERIRTLSSVQLSTINGALAKPTFQAATRGDTDCQSEAGGCSSGGWSCINWSCC